MEAEWNLFPERKKKKNLEPHRVLLSFTSTLQGDGAGSRGDPTSRIRPYDRSVWLGFSGDVPDWGCRPCSLSTQYPCAAYQYTWVLSLFSCVQHFVTPWTVAHHASLSMGFSRQEYWGGLPCPPPKDLSDPGVEPKSLMSPALAGGFFTEGGWRRVSRHVIWVKGVYMQSSAYFCRRFLLDTRKRLHHEGFWYFSSSEEMQELGSENLLWKISIWRPVLPFSPEHRVPHSCSPPWAPFRGCWRSATVAVHDLICVEVDDNCQFVLKLAGFPGGSGSK